MASESGGLKANSNCDSTVETPCAATLMSDLEATLGRCSISDEAKGELVKTEELVGASPFFDYHMYLYREDQSKSSTVPESWEIQNELRKHIPFERELLKKLEHFAGRKEVCVWMSETLAWDLNLPMTSGPPCLPGLLQAFVICVGRPPLLLTLWDKGDHSAEVETYSSDTAQMLHWSLLDFCHQDFTVLRVSATRQDFLRETVSLKEEVKAKAAEARRYFKSPMNLTEGTFKALRKATTALVGATFVPCFLEDVPREEMWLLLMDKEWRSAVSQLIELLDREGRYKLTYSPAASPSAKVVVALEAAKRISFAVTVRATCMAEKVQKCLQRLTQHVKDELDIDLQLTYLPGDLTEEGSVQDPTGQTEVTIVLEATTERHLLLQRMYELIVDGQLPELCQHPSLGSPTFLRDLLDFCTRQKNDEQFVVGTLDNKSSLPLLYWSLWSDSPHLTHLCLTEMMDHVADGDVLSESLLSAVLATMMTAARDDRTRVKAKQLIKKLTDMQTKHSSSDTMKLVLPYPEHCHTEEGKTRYAEMKTRLKSDSMCYLDDPSLPIPATLLSVTVTENAVSVELPSQHWYLALRLLADREVDETDDDGNTLLHLAADAGHPQVIAVVVKSGASVTVTNRKGLTSYQLAQRRSEEKEHVSGFLDISLSDGLHQACSEGDVERLKVLLCQGASLSGKGGNGKTPLHSASCAGQAEVASLIIQLGAAIDAKVRYLGLTPLHCACRNGHSDTVRLLVELGADVNVKGEYGDTPLHYACQYGHVDTVGLLVELGADVNVKRKYGYTPLHYACQHGHVDIVRLLVELGADVNVKGEHGVTPLHYACWHGHVDNVGLLVELGADVNVKGECGDTPLHYACWHGHVDTVGLLVELGADVNMKRDDGDTPLHYACQNGHVDTVELLVDLGADVNVKRKYGVTPLHYACWHDDVNIVRLLVEHGADVNVMKDEWDTPLQYARRSGDEDTVRLLLKHGADFNVKRDERDTPLQYARRSGYMDIVRLLLKHGADFNVKGT